MRGLRVDKEDKEDEIERKRMNKDERVKELWKDEEEKLLDKQTKALGTREKNKPNRFFFFVLEEGYGEYCKT
jgi:hypothetical protein